MFYTVAALISDLSLLTKASSHICEIRYADVKPAFKRTGKASASCINARVRYSVLSCYVTNGLINSSTPFKACGSSKASNTEVLRISKPGLLIWKKYFRPPRTFCANAVSAFLTSSPLQGRRLGMKDVVPKTYYFRKQCLLFLVL